MATALTSATLEMSLGVVQTSSNTLVTNKITPTVTNKTAYTSGTAAGSVDQCHLKSYTISAGATTVLDLNDGTLVDLNGDAITPAKLRGILVIHAAASLASSIFLDGRQTAGGTISGATNASPIVITSSGHKLITGDSVTIAGVGGNTNANSTWTITRVSSSTFSLDTSTGNSAYTSGGIWVASLHQIGDAQSTLAPGEGVTVNRPAGGWTLTNSTADKVRITNLDGSNAATVSLGLLCTSA